MEDHQLLSDYAQRGSEPAFRTLVERHLSLVYSCALRRVNDPQLAEEITQTVFILLARKARSLNRKTVLAGWLFCTTRFVASRARRTEQRRQRREQEAFEMHKIATEQDPWNRIAPGLDEALEKLGESDRNAVLLRFVEGNNHREIGAVLGLSEEAARKRVDRALEKLRGLFAGRGLTLSGTVLASALGANAATVAPAALVNSVGTAAIAGGTASASALPAMVEQTLNAWQRTRIRTAATLATGAACLLVCGLLLTLPGRHQPATAIPSASDNAGVEMASAQTNARRPRVEVRSNRNAPAVPVQTMRFQVLARDTGAPVAHAKLVLVAAAKPEWLQRYDLSTDEQGVCVVPFPVGTGRLNVGVLADGWSARYATWSPHKDDPIPAEYTLRVDAVSNSLGGILRDESGNPVSGAEIWATFGSAGDASWRETPRERDGIPLDAPIARSDRSRPLEFHGGSTN